MKRLSLLVVTLTLLIPESSLTQPRPLTPAISCGRAKPLVASRGAIELGTGQHSYNRYVRSQAFCYPPMIRPAWVPTADTPRCFVGYTCVEDHPLGPLDD